jgi:hypothetical protein
MVSTIAVEIVRVDKDTLKLLKYPLHVRPARALVLHILAMPHCFTKNNKPLE